MKTIKNSKETSSMRNNRLVSVIVAGQTVGYILYYKRETYNSFGGTNYWDCFQYIPKEEFSQKYDFIEWCDNIICEDLKLYNRTPRTFFRLGKRDGEVHKMFLLNKELFMSVTFSLQECNYYAESFREVLPYVELRWGSEDTPINELNFYCDGETIVAVYPKGEGYTAIYVTKDTHKVYWSDTTIATAEQIKSLAEGNGSIEEEEAPEHCDVEVPQTEERPKRMRKPSKIQ